MMKTSLALSTVAALIFCACETSDPEKYQECKIEQKVKFADFNQSAKKYETMTLAQAKKFCEGVSKGADKTYRLPTQQEAKYCVKFHKQDEPDKLKTKQRFWIQAQSKISHNVVISSLSKKDHNELTTSAAQNDFNITNPLSVSAFCVSER